MERMSLVERSSVQITECDRMGHMNVRHYFAHNANGMGVLLTRLGLGPRAAYEKGLVWLARDNHVRFLREFRPNDPFTVRAGLAAVEATRLRVYCEIVHTGSDIVGAAITTTLELAPLAAPGDATAIPPQVLEKAERMRVGIPAHGAPRGLARNSLRRLGTLSEAEDLNLFTSFMTLVRPDHCDRAGLMRNEVFVAMVSDGIPNIFAASRDEAAIANRGGAAVEQLLIYDSRPREGDILVLKSGVRAITDSKIHWAHWMFDAESGRLVSIIESLALSMDLAARKAIPVLPEVRAVLSKRLVPAGIA